MTEQENGNGLKVTFSVKELLTEISRDIKDLRSELNSKANQVYVEVLVARLDGMELKVNTIETQGLQTTNWKELWVPVISSGITGAIMGGIAVAAILVNVIKP